VETHPIHDDAHNAFMTRHRYTLEERKRKCFAAVVAGALRHLRHEEDLVDSPDPAGMRADEKTSNHEKG
jgi:hypothetical protein